MVASNILTTPSTKNPDENNNSHTKLTPINIILSSCQDFEAVAHQAKKDKKSKLATKMSHSK